MKTERISWEEREKIAWIGFGHRCDKSMTVLDVETLEELTSITEQLGRATHLKGVVFFTHKKRCFLAGVDINIFDQFKKESDATERSAQGQNLFNQIESLKIPTLVCVHGICLGGGTEFALACDHILVSDDPNTQIGLPEVKLGILPGLGGTWRLPQKIGLAKALDMILTGKSIRATKCVQWGLAAESYPNERLLEMALRHLYQSKPRKSTLSENILVRKVIFQKARDSVFKKTLGLYQAPLKILDTMETGLGRGQRAYLNAEARAFGELCMGEQSQNLRHLFFLSEKSKKFPLPPPARKLNIQRGAVLGAGVMGGGIAWLMAKNNATPLMKDIRLESLELGLRQASSFFTESLSRKRMSEDDYRRKMRSIFPTLNYRGFAKTQLVVEAVVEDIAVKKSVLSEVERHVHPDCILTSNTSSLSISQLSECLKYPERFAGLHFFNPVNRMPLVEIITHKQTSLETVEALYKWCLSTGKTPLIVKDCPGFLVNRLLIPYLNEATWLLEEGYELKDIDQACVHFGMPMGPFHLMDEIGLDVVKKVISVFSQLEGSVIHLNKVFESVSQSNLLGKKGGKGFYHYNAKGKKESVNSSLYPSSVSKKSTNETLIQKRLLFPMINEATKALTEGIVPNPSDIDLGTVFGIGFPPFRGGLYKYACGEGFENILVELENFAKKVSPQRYRPSDWLKNKVLKNKRTHDFCLLSLLHFLYPLCSLPPMAAHSSGFGTNSLLLCPHSLTKYYVRLSSQSN